MVRWVRIRSWGLVADPLANPDCGLVLECRKGPCSSMILRALEALSTLRNACAALKRAQCSQKCMCRTKSRAMFEGAESCWGPPPQYRRVTRPLAAFQEKATIMICKE
eukprot:8401755-Alexandrium_andersonii.AAC.1